MPRYNPREGDPQRYARAMAQQSELRKQCAGQYTVARILLFRAVFPPSAGTRI